MTARLRVVDDYEDEAARLQAHASEADGPDVLLWGLSNAWFRWRYPAASDVRLIDPTPFAREAQRRVEAFLVDLVDRLPQARLGETTLGASLEGLDAGAWWYLEISEKSAFRGSLVEQLYRLALLRLVIDSRQYEGISVRVADAALGDLLEQVYSGTPAIQVERRVVARSARWWEGRPSLRYWAHALSLVASFLSVRLVIALARWPVPAVDPGRIAIFSFFPAWWAAPFGDGATERFIASPPEPQSSCYAVWLGSARALWRHRRSVARLMGERRLVPLQPLVTIGTALRRLSPQRFRRTGRVRRVLAGRLHQDFMGFDIGPLVEREIVRSLTSGEVFQDPLLCDATRAFARRYSPRAVVYRAEFQPTESAVLRGLDGLTRRIGFVHYPFDWLPMRFAAGELARHLQRAHPGADRPLPDGVVACGTTGTRRLAEQGYPWPWTASCGPQRHDRFVAYLRNRPSSDVVRARLNVAPGIPVFLVAIAIREADSGALFGALVEAVSGLGDFRLLIKTHPNRPQGDEATATAMAALGRDRAVLLGAGVDMYDAISAADAMICIGSTIAFEAMALGVMPVVFDNPATFPATSLSGFQPGLFVVRNGRELRDALAAICTDSGLAQEKRRQWPAIVRDVLGDLDTPLPQQMAGALAALEQIAHLSDVNP